MTMPHPDDEQLEAHRDGEAGAEIADHVAECPECAARVEDLDRVAAAVAAPVAPPPPAVREAAVAAALAAWDGAGTGELVRMPSAAAAADSVTRRPVPRWLAAAAVLVVVALAAVPFLRAGGGDDAVLSGGAVSEKAGEDGAGRGAVPADLGDVEDEAALNAALGRVLGVAIVEFSADAAADEMGGAPDEDGDSDATALSEPFRRDVTPSAGQASPPATTPAPCRADAAAYAGEEHTMLAYSASLRWKSRPAYVYVFLRSGSDQPLSRRAVVVERAGCGLLVVQSF